MKKKWKIGSKLWVADYEVGVTPGETYDHERCYRVVMHEIETDPLGTEYWSRIRSFMDVKAVEIEELLRAHPEVEEESE
jgi:hypothetical protein